MLDQGDRVFDDAANEGIPFFLAKWTIEDIPSDSPAFATKRIESRKIQLGSPNELRDDLPLQRFYERIELNFAFSILCHPWAVEATCPIGIRVHPFHSVSGQPSEETLVNEEVCGDSASMPDRRYSTNARCLLNSTLD
jgi:hypothetical protein